VIGSVKNLPQCGLSFKKLAALRDCFIRDLNLGWSIWPTFLSEIKGDCFLLVKIKGGALLFSFDGVSSQ